MAGTVELRNGRTKLVVETATGSVLRVEDTSTGVAHIDATNAGRSDGRLFQLTTPGGIWWSCPAYSYQQEQVDVERSGEGLVISYPDLKAADAAQTGVAVTVRISPGGADEFLFSMRVENRGSRTVLDTLFPQIGGWYDHGNDRIAMGANSFVDPRTLASTAGNNYARNGRRKAWTYPIFMVCPWADLPGEGGGLSWINYMEQARGGQFTADNMAAYGDEFRLMLGWLNYLALESGDTWESPPIGISVHDGDWRRTADRYRAWFDARFPPDYSRPKVRTRMGFQNVFFRGFDGTPFRPLESVPGVAREGRDAGVDMLCVWDTFTLGKYARTDPHDLTDYPPEDRDVLARAIAQAESHGSSVCALTNMRHPNVALHLNDPDILNRVQKRFVGTYRTENWAGNHMFGDLFAWHIGPESYVFSPFSEAHRDRVKRISRDYCELGYTSMFYDQPFEQWPDYGFRKKGHAPELTHHEALALVGEVREILLEGDPNAIIIGEECDALATQWIDQWMSWSIADATDESIERMHMMRYSLPHTMLSRVVDHQPDRAAAAFAQGMYFCLMVHGGEGTLADVPDFGERVRAMSELRKKTADRTVMARFRGHDGLTIDGDDGLIAYVYESDAGPAVMAAALRDDAKGKVTVDLEALGATAKGDGSVLTLDGAEKSQSGTTCEFDLKADEVAVWEL